MVGYKLQDGDRVAIIEDVITAGTAIREALDLVAGGGGIVSGIVVALDRQEMLDDGDRRAIRRALVERMGEFRGQREAARAEFETLLATLRADPFDPAATTAALKAIETRMTERLDLGRVRSDVQADDHRHQRCARRRARLRQGQLAVDGRRHLGPRRAQVLWHAVLGRLTCRIHWRTP